MLEDRIYIWLLLFQEFDFKFIVKPGKLNAGLDHMSMVNNGEKITNLDANFPDAHLFLVHVFDEYFSYIIEYLSTRNAPKDFSTMQKKHLVVKVEDYQLTAGHLYKMGTDRILRRCVLEHELPIILVESHEGIDGLQYVGKATAHKVFHTGLWWPIVHKYAKEYCKQCDVFHRVVLRGQKSFNSIVGTKPT
jgi:hypothetical protein